MHLTIVLDMEKQDSIRDISSDISMIINEEHTTELTRAVLVTVVFVAKMLQQEKLSSSSPSCCHCFPKKLPSIQW